MAEIKKGKEPKEFSQCRRQNFSSYVDMPYVPISEEELLTKLKISRETGKYRDADDVVLDMRLKYGL